MGRAPCCDKTNVKRGPWSPEEDAKLKAYIEKFGTGGNWIALPQKIGLKRCGKSCRLRWLNYLRPNIKHGGFTEEEDNIILNLYISIGSRWSIIAAQLPGRTDNDIKNYWNTRLKKKLLGRRKQQGGLNGSKDEVPALSSSALERLQLHMQLQSQQNTFSYLNNPTLWPKLHPLIQEKLLQNNLSASLNQLPYTYNNNSSHNNINDTSNEVGFFRQSATLLQYNTSDNNKNSQDSNNNHIALGEELESSSQNGSAISESSNGNVDDISDIKNIENLANVTGSLLKPEEYNGMQRISSFQAELDKLLGNGKGIELMPQEGNQVSNNGFEGMSSWWSNDQANSSNWDYYQDYAN